MADVELLERVELFDLRNEAGSRVRVRVSGEHTLGVGQQQQQLRAD